MSTQPLVFATVIVALVVCGIVILSIYRAPNEYAVAVAGIATATVIAMFKYWPFR